jgi:hypothetical protein
MSTLRVTTVTNPSGGQPTIDGLAKAWVNFNGTGTVAIRASLNVSSITDNGTADYTVNFTTAFADTNYVMTAIAGGTGGGQAMMVSPGASAGGYGGQTTTSCRFTAWTWNVSLNDPSYVTAAFFR